VVRRVHRRTTVCRLGLYTDGNGVARFQAVDTHPDHRRCGLAGSLVHHAGAEGLTWPGVQTLVILADPGDDAIRVYRSVGFDGTETQVQLLRAGHDDAADPAAPQ
jgi:predicted GNAT family acetyltransferase